jgi:hypothetical protein
LVLHTGPAAVVAGEQATGLLGRITKLKREGRELGHLLDYAEKWNQADVSAATRGVGKDRLPIVDPAGPKCTEGHFIRLKRAVREFDNAWHDATSNVVVSFTNLCNFSVDAGFILSGFIYISSQSPSFGLRAQLLAQNFL